MDLHRICVKIYAEAPETLELEAFIPVFHRWIQTHAVEGQLIDVADYGHLPRSPGVVLVAHGAEYLLDQSEGPLGLMYSRKAPSPGELPDRIAAAFKAALAACVRLEGEPEFRGKLRFRSGEARVIANDRLHAPNSEEAFLALRPALEAALARIYASPCTLRRDGLDPRSRLTVHVTAAQPAELPALLARLG